MNLQLFCDETSRRYAIDKPAVRGGWQYATDGRIVVRVPSEAADTGGKYPKVEWVFDNFPACEASWPTWQPVRMELPGGVRVVPLDGCRYQAWYLRLIGSQCAGLRCCVRDDCCLCFTADGGVQGVLKNWGEEPC